MSTTTRYSNSQDNAFNTGGLFAFILLMLVIIGIVFLTSCTSRSANIPHPNYKAERVVVLDSDPYIYLRDVPNTPYKVKRIEKGVVTWVNILGKSKYEIGDTILYTFKVE